MKNKFMLVSILAAFILLFSGVTSANEGDSSSGEVVEESMPEESTTATDQPAGEEESSADSVVWED